MVFADIDWTNVLDSAIFTVPAVVAAVYAGRIHRQIRTPSGKTLGETIEYAHDTAIANNLLLSTANGPTKTADPEDLRVEGASPPQVPTDQGGT